MTLNRLGRLLGRSWAILRRSWPHAWHFYVRILGRKQQLRLMFRTFHDNPRVKMRNVDPKGVIRTQGPPLLNPVKKLEKYACPSWGQLRRPGGQKVESKAPTRINRTDPKVKTSEGRKVKKPCGPLHLNLRSQTAEKHALLDLGGVHPLPLNLNKGLPRKNPNLRP